MTLSLTRMRALVRRGLGGLDSDDITDDEVDELLNLSLWELDNRFPFKEKECLVTASTVAGQADYALPSDLDAIRTVSIVDDDTERYVPLKQMDVQDFEEKAQEDDEDDRDQPTHYMRRDNGVHLHPIPDKVYTLRLNMWRTVASLVEGTIEETGLPRNWDEIVVEGAVTRGHFYTQDYNLARQAENFRVGHERGAVLDEHKEKRGARYARIKPIFEWPSEERTDLDVHTGGQHKES